jgi:glucose/arabinose dehydrogenase
MLRSMTSWMIALCAALAVSPGASVAQIPLTTTRVASGLNRPIYVTHAPGDFDRVFIVQQSGEIMILDLAGETLLGTPFLDLSSVVSCCDERGLLGLAFHPDYQTNGFFYVNYTNSSGDTEIVRYQVMGSPATSNTADSTSAFAILLLTQPTVNHNGGWIDFGPNDGYLYIATGDGGFGCDPSQRAQDLTDEPMGKILRIDVNGGTPFAIPPNNPFVGVAGDDEIWAYGLRNPFRCAFDSETGDLYVGDVGQNEIEEIDFQPGSSSGGENYGWDCMEGDQCSDVSSGCSPSGCVCNAPGLVPPIHQYTHSIGNVITGGEVYRGCAISDLGGAYFFADFGSDRIWSFVYDGTLQNFTERTSELAPGGGLSISSVSSFGRDAQGEVYICDLFGGEVFKIVPDTAGPALDCNANSVEDACDIGSGASSDINQNGIPDECDIAVPALSPTGLLLVVLIILTASLVIGVRQWKAV